MNDETPVICLFLDCLGYEEAEEHDVLDATLRGKVESGTPRVTPKVITEIITGEKPTDSGVLCPTRLYKNNIVRPLTETLFETLSNERRVLNYETPFSMNLQGMFLTNVGSAPQAMDQQRPGFAVLPRAGGQMWTEDKEKLLQAHIDYVRGVFSTIRNLGRNGMFDAMFPTIRNIDSFGHFLFKDYRKRLIKYVNRELMETFMMGDMKAKVLWYSDHGITEKEESFYINKWLEEKGYLDTKVLYNKIEKQREQQEEQGQDPMTQVSVHSPFCEVSKDSKAVSPDAYDSGVKILSDDVDVDELKSELMSTGMFNGVYTPQELYGEGEYGSDTLGIDLVLDRADGILVTGNVHKDLHGVKSSEIGDVHCQGELRSGVHSRYGAWGSSDDALDDADVEPVELHSILKKFVQRNAPTPTMENLYGTSEMAEGSEAKIKDRLKDLGYI